ncbi:hypothetical protein A3F02_03840 [Candidatus Curtissbacteria bacterium RIFCSPHIGHO2_12_FULL_38_9b]|uniref:Uncharacterized protein n=1 Tax=Candidatus Curtissbacteria bacterium RIFCSPHIGHO2_12_FULL_38_9b TaxID=1797720 RepID=A0A1F5GSV1_9BACT|nr:MAG: hypothetical protein A3F02_03840 [Candidatus Curtissbacteria bacterium RIFCSPHIGHO2_12_FULL_38_9b]
MARPEDQPLHRQLEDLDLSTGDVVYSLTQVGVRPAVALRAAVHGDIPQKGPGVYSIGNRLRTARQMQELNGNPGNKQKKG